MHRPSMFLTIMRQSIQPHADAGASIPAQVVPALCDLLRHIAAECERMENRLSGEALEPADFADGKIVSLSAWAAAKGIIAPLRPEQGEGA